MLTHVKETSKSALLALCEGNLPVNSPHKGPITGKKLSCHNEDQSAACTASSLVRLDFIPMWNRIIITNRDGSQICTSRRIYPHQYMDFIKGIGIIREKVLEISYSCRRNGNGVTLMTIFVTCSPEVVILTTYPSDENFVKHNSNSHIFWCGRNMQFQRTGFNFSKCRITPTPYMVLPLFATRFAAYAGGIRVSFIQPHLF